MFVRLTILFVLFGYFSVYAQNNTTVATTAASGASAATTAACVDAINCTLYKVYCNNPAYTKLLCEDCQKTCDFCGPIGQSICAQYNPTSPPCTDMAGADCSQFAQECSNPVFRSTLCQDCRATCGLCGTRYNDECVAPSNDPTCVDNTDCTGFLTLCNSLSNKQTMCSQCKKSCKFCAPSTYCL